MIYSNLRSMLSIEPKFRNFGIEVNECQQNRQAKSAENLNVIGLGLAGLGLIATLIPQSVPRNIAVGALTFVVMSAIIFRGRK
jgi:protein-S-isoprenylcysteine O-methyltransferase Ste14